MNIVQGHIDFMNQYYEHYDMYFQDIIAAHGRTEDANEYWLDAVSRIVGVVDGNTPVVKLENLAEVLALIHPDFFYNRHGDRFRRLDYLTPGVFTQLGRQGDCSHGEITGTKCIFLDNDIEADHVWPASLGGPRHRNNFMPLCDEHNGMKANSIVLFNHTEVPPWLGSSLNKLRAHKRP